MAFSVKVENTYSGPMDLLLYLVKRDEIDIHDIPVSHLTKEYLAEIDKMDLVDVDAGGEFVSMASMLTEIKSRMLIPPSEDEDGQEGDEDYDPRQGLVAALLEYKRFKEIASELESLSDSFSKRHGRVSPYIPQMPVDLADEARELGALDLFAAFQKIARKMLNNSAPKEIINEEIATEVRIEQIEQVIAVRGRVSFTSLLSDSPTRDEMVGFFIALLELIRLKKIVAQQSIDFSEIYLSDTSAIESSPIELPNDESCCVTTKRFALSLSSPLVLRRELPVMHCNPLQICNAFILRKSNDTQQRLSQSNPYDFIGYTRVKDSDNTCRRFIFANMFGLGFRSLRAINRTIEMSCLVQSSEDIGISNAVALHDVKRKLTGRRAFNASDFLGMRRSLNISEINRNNVTRNKYDFIVRCCDVVDDSGCSSSHSLGFLRLKLFSNRKPRDDYNVLPLDDELNPGVGEVVTADIKPSSHAFKGALRLFMPLSATVQVTKSGVRDRLSTIFTLSGEGNRSEQKPVNSNKGIFASIPYRAAGKRAAAGVGLYRQVVAKDKADTCNVCSASSLTAQEANSLDILHAKHGAASKLPSFLGMTLSHASANSEIDNKICSSTFMPLTKATQQATIKPQRLSKTGSSLFFF